MASVERLQTESAEKPEDAVSKLQRLKKALARARASLEKDDPGRDAASLSRNLGDVAAEMKLWDTCLEEIRVGLADLIEERDRWRIAHDKLRERIDRHALEPRSQPEQKPESGRMPKAPKIRMSSDESQDFSAIDEQLELLNASMLKAFSSD